MPSWKSPKMCEIEKHSEIQSGQFMISKLDDSDSEKEESETQEDIESISPDRGSGALAFDTLQSLFRSLRLANVNTVNSPRWSHFKGTGFALKQKVRLNNIIWREYHMQYVKQRSPVVVRFEAPTSDTTHIKTQCLVMDGKFRNRHSNKLSNEYRRWRIFYIKNLRKKPIKNFRSSQDFSDLDHLPMDFPLGVKPLNDKEDFICDIPNFSTNESPRFLDDLMKDFDGGLDLFFDQPFPDPRDMSMLGNSDIMQPGLTQLQPNSGDYRSDLIAGLLQQPAMPTIMEDDYSSQDRYYHQCECASPQIATVSEGLDASRQPRFPPFEQHQQQSQQVTPPHQAQLASCQSSNSTTSTNYTPDCSYGSGRASFQQTPSRSPRGNMVLLNALLQKPLRESEGDAEDLVGGDGNRARHQSTSSANASSPENFAPASQYKRQPPQPNHPAGNALIVDVSTETQSASTPGPLITPTSRPVFMEEASTAYVDPTEKVCDSLPRTCLPNLNDTSPYNLQSFGIVKKRYANSNLPLLVRSATSAPPPPYATTNSAACSSQKHVSHYRRPRSQYHPNPPPYRRPQLNSLPRNSASTTTTATTTTSSAPDLYGICPPQLVPSTKQPGFKAPSGEMDDDEEDFQVDDSNDNDDTDFDNFLITGVDDCRGGAGDAGDDDDIKSILRDGPASASSGSSTEKRRRLSMQSSLKLLHQLVQQNQERRAGPGGAGMTKRASIGSTGGGVGGLGEPSASSAAAASVHQQKTSKASILRDGAELIRSQRAVRDQLDAEILRLRAELDSLQESVSACCDKLPTSGAMSKQQVKSMKRSARTWFRNLVATATQANWKFYIFSLIFTDVFETYCDKVCCSASREVLRRSTVSWLEDHCDLPQLRKLVMQALCNLSTTTNVLQEPNLLPQQAREAASRLALQGSPPPGPSTTAVAAPPPLPPPSLVGTAAPSGLMHFSTNHVALPPPPPRIDHHQHHRPHLASATSSAITNSSGSSADHSNSTGAPFLPGPQ